MKTITKDEFLKDALNWEGALNSASWKFWETSEEKSTKLFNTCKPAVMAAIIEYADKVFDNVDDLVRENHTMKLALAMIAGLKNYPNNLMSNVDIAKEALALVSKEVTNAKD